jgi:hypothetical protein
VELVTSADAAKVESFIFTIDYRFAIMQPMLGAADLASIVAGTKLDGWSVTVAGRSQGRLSLRLAAPAGKSITGTGTILGIPFITYIGDSITSDLPFSIEPEARECTRFETERGLLSLDSICGMSFRIVQAFGIKYALEQNSPNPFNPSTDIEFSLGLDGPTRLEVFDVSGNRVALLVDGYLQPGVYRVTWVADAFPTGIYYYRLTSGDWSQTNRMVIGK